MAHDANLKTPESIARRKEFLMAQGAVFRSQLAHAQSGVRASLRPASLAQSALSNLAMLGYAALKSRVRLGTLRTLLPMVIGGISAISKKDLKKPLIRGGLILAAAGTIAAVVARRRKARKLRGE